jgi:class 3 adenylate cyclase
MAETRKLAAILAADVVGYSRLAGSDEDRTLSRLRGLRSDLVDPAIAAHHGRIVKRTGDGQGSGGGAGTEAVDRLVASLVLIKTQASSPHPSGTTPWVANRTRRPVSALVDAPSRPHGGKSFRLGRAMRSICIPNRPLS